MTERDIFFAALDKATPEERAAYVDGACGQDLALRRRVEKLLQEHFSNDSLLREPTADGAPTAEGGVTQLGGSPVLEGPGTQIGRYKLLEKLGEGGFGVVYMAEQKEPVRRRVALKIIKLGMDTEQVVARFEAERQALAMMDHPNIARVFDAGATETGRPYFVMELVKGVAITKYCDENELSTKERLELFIPVCQAIQHAHQKGVIHRDIKPSNVMITLHDGVPVPKVIDFGIAKATQQELTEKTIFTQYSQFIGTPAYMSPEQAEMSGLDIDTRSDIYSLGVLLYELLVGRPPLEAKELLALGLDEMRRIIREQELVKPSTRLSQLVVAATRESAALPGKENGGALTRRRYNQEQVRALRGDLDWVVMKALEKDRNRRYETANGFASDLKRYLAHEPVTAVAPSPGYLVGKYVRRHRVALTVAAVIAGLLVAGTGVSTWEAIRANRASVVANGERRTAQNERDIARKAQEETEHLLYIAKMNLAQQAWEQGNVGRLREILRETESFPDRGFEWYFWQRRIHFAVKTFRGHKAMLWSLAFSPDSRQLITASGDRTAKLWDVETGHELLTLQGHTDHVESVAFSPNGKQIATASWDYTARIWDLSTRRELEVLKGHTNAVCAVCFSPDGQRIVTGSKDSTARVWDTASATEIFAFKGHPASVSSVAYSPDGKWIVSGCGDEESEDVGDHLAKVWEAVTGKEILSLTGHTLQIRAVAVSPDGQRIATGSQDRTAKIWDRETGQLLFTLKGHEAAISSVSFSPDGQRIVTGSEDQSVKVWDAVNGKELVVLKEQAAPIMSVSFSPDGRWIAAASGAWMGNAERTVKIWSASIGEEPRTLSVEGKYVYCPVFTPGGLRVAIAPREGPSQEIWDPEGHQKSISLDGHSGSMQDLAFSPDGQRIVTGSADHTARVWDAATGKELRILTNHHNLVRSVILFERII